MTKSLQGKNAIVTGGSRGIGKGIALELANRGANVLITYNAAAQKADEVVALLQEKGVKAACVQANGQDIEAPKKVVQAAISLYQTIDIIVNNAGAGDDVLFEALDYSIWAKILDTNTRFPAFLVKESIPHFGSTPRIINISSVMGRMGGWYSAAYTASKAALEGLTKVMAQELGQKYNATFNCLSTGPVETDMWMADSAPEVLAEWQPRIELTPAAKRIAQPDDIAQIAAFLSEEGSRWVTASTVCASGGLCPI